VGTIDLLTVDPRHRVEEIADALVEEALRSAANKACVRVETTRPADAGEHDRWVRHGFATDGELLVRPVERARIGRQEA
jgi:ribosomal protein S18 acetylase RimI-like enzyme